MNIYPRDNQPVLKYKNRIQGSKLCISVSMMCTERRLKHTGFLTSIFPGVCCLLTVYFVAFCFVHAKFHVFF